MLSSIRFLLVRCHQHKGAGAALSPTPPLLLSLEGHVYSLALSPGHDWHLWIEGKV